MLGPKDLSILAGVPVEQPGLFFPQAGWVVPTEVIAALTRESAVVLRQSVSSLVHQGGVWRVTAEDGATIAEADLVVAACANSLLGLAETAWLPLEPKRGQITLAHESDASAPLATVLAGKGYITPSEDGRHCLGATYSDVGTDGWRRAPGITDQDHKMNLETLHHLGMSFSVDPDPDEVTGRAALRATTPDRLPIAGPVPKRDEYLAAYRELGEGHRWVQYSDPPYEGGLYVLTGLGARGFVTAFMGADLIAAQVCGEPLPIEADLVEALHPGRFLIRDLKRLKI